MSNVRYQQIASLEKNISKNRQSTIWKFMPEGGSNLDSALSHLSKRLRDEVENSYRVMCNGKVYQQTELLSLLQGWKKQSRE